MFLVNPPRGGLCCPDRPFQPCCAEKSLSRSNCWLVWAFCSLLIPGLLQAAPKTKATGDPYDKMSSMGRLAHQVAVARNGATAGHLGKLLKDFPPNGDEGDGDGPAGGQAETSIAVDATGQHIVVGFNDTRGFNLSPTSISGFAYSDDGGATFIDGGQLPTSGSKQVFGDPDIKYVPGGTGLQFIYSSILVTSTAQTICLHRSTDGGHTWQGPFEVTAATNPNSTADAADKEFIDVDPDSGRVIVSWSDFTSANAGGVEDLDQLQRQRDDGKSSVMVSTVGPEYGSDDL